MIAGRAGRGAELDLGRLAARAQDAIGGAEGVSIVVDSWDMLVTVGATGLTSPYVGRAVEMRDTFTAARAMHTGAPVYCDDIDADDRVIFDVRSDPHLRSLLVIPLADEDGSPFGLLVVVSGHPAAFPAGARAQAKRVAEGVAMVLARGL